MMKFVFGSAVALTTGLALASATTPAQARGEDQGNGIQSAPGTSDPGSANPQAREKRYCFVATVTGSRIPAKICKTRKEWEAEGVEIPANR